jgi:hypothetical protein
MNEEEWSSMHKRISSSEPEQYAPANHPFAPRGTVFDSGQHIPEFGFSINKKIECWCDNIEELYERGKAGQWDASKDIHWQSLPKLDYQLEKAVCQVMTFLAQNEYIALYLPGRFISKINPHFSEVVLFLSTQLADEARHIEVFTRRARANGVGLQKLSYATQWSLKSLLSQDDYADASFLLNILGEGTFESLFRFLYLVSPDSVTKEIISKAMQDESRHVGYGVSRTKYQLKQDPSLARRFLHVSEERASYLYAVSGADADVYDAFAILAAGGGSDARQVELGRERVKQMYAQMFVDRTNRLRQAGFDSATALKISELHGTAVKSFM